MVGGMLRAVASLVVLVTLGSGAAVCAARAPARAEPLPYIEVVTGGAPSDAELPLVIALHGRGDTPDGFAGLFKGWDMRARVVIPRPPHPWSGGHAWTPHDHLARDKGAAIASDLGGLADRVVATADAVRRARPTRGAGVVMGFSQGGMMAWTIAVRHPRAFTAAFPVAGFLFPEVLARHSITGVRLPPIVAFHGTADQLVPLADDRRGVKLLEQKGGRADLRIYDGVGHDIPPPLRTDLFREMGAALMRADAAGQK
jgi:phospholipase/carboxylesterase